MHTNKYIDYKRCKGENGKKECRKMMKGFSNRLNRVTEHERGTQQITDLHRERGGGK